MRLVPPAALSLALALTAPATLAQETQLDAKRAASRASPLDANLALHYGTALRRAGHAVEAATELRRGTTLPGSGQGDTGVMLRYELARTLIDRRDFHGAMVACATIKSVPGAAAAAASHACAAEAHLLWRRASEALLETAQALEGGTKSYEAKVAEGLSFELQVKDIEAEAAFREAIAWRPDAPEAHVALGRLLVRTQRRDEGKVELWRAASELDPHGPEAAYELALVLPTTGDTAALLEKATREKPSYGLALLRLAEVDLELGRGDGARAAADAAIRINPGEPAAYVVSGRVALGEGKPDDALKAGQKALSILSNSAQAKLLVADAYSAKGEIDLAIEAYQAAYGLDPGDPTALVHASVACHAQGRDTSARAFGDRATHDFPSWGPGWVALGDALVGQGEKALARSAYETALKAQGPVDQASVRAKLAAVR